MEIQSYNKELQIANILFKRLFNNIRIEKGNQIIQYKCVIGNRSRILKGLENPDKNAIEQLPMIIIQRTGITKNNERLSNLNNEIKYAPHSKMIIKDLLTPVPIDITYEVTIVSKWQEHIDRAISNFIPFFNKDLFVRTEHPKFEGLFFTNQVIMDDTISEDHPSDIDPGTDDLITCTINFTYKTCFFCGNNRVQGSQTVISTWTETSSYVGLSSFVYQLTDQDKQHISDFLSCPLSTTIQKTVSSEIEVTMSTEVEISGGFVPTINKLYLGFYPVPLLSAYNPHINWVDSIPEDVIGIGVGGETITTSAAFYPYVDRISWNI